MVIFSVVGFVCAAAVASASADWWRPPQQLTWYWQLQGTVKSEPVMATDMDMFDNGANVVSAFHAQKQHLIAYIDVGTWENWRPDASAFPASVKGRNNGWPGEKWLDIRQLSILMPIMQKRMDLAKSEGYDAVEPDNMDGWENSTGFPITAQQQVDYNKAIASYAHSIGLAVFQKNDIEQVPQLVTCFDGMINEQGNQYSEMSGALPYIQAGKPVLNAEYSKNVVSKAKAYDNANKIMGALFNTALDGSVFQPFWP